jgi:hypothetical protein
LKSLATPDDWVCLAHEGMEVEFGAAVERLRVT